MARREPSFPHKRTVVVTGTSAGLGLNIAKHLTVGGYRVIGIARREVDRAEVGGGYEHMRADLHELDALPDVAHSVIRRWGTPYALINNAAGAVDGLLPLMADNGIREAIELDLLSPILLAKHFSRPMISEGLGRIVNISSISASTGFRGLSVYSAAKAGLEGFTRALARDLGGRGVTVNCVAPGFLDTAMTGGISDPNMTRIQSRSPMRRFARLTEVAGAVAYYLSEDAAGVTGTTLTVDAGATA